MELTKQERLLLFNQYEILKLLSGDDEYAKKQYEVEQDIVFNGYKRDYEMLVEHFSEDVPDTVTETVWDVLEMYRAINNSYTVLKDEQKTGIEVDKLEFRGFDGNDESEYYCYCLFVLEKLERYGEFTESGRRDLNTHWPILGRYERMLEKWKSFGDRYGELSRDQILEIINA